MSAVTLTLQFASLAEAATALSSLATPARTVIAHEDRPDVGAEPPAAPATKVVDNWQQTSLTAPPDLAAVFGQQQAAPSQQAALPLAPPAPPAVPVAPAVPPVPPVVPILPQASATAPELDVTGLPWDARIHAETKSKNKDGSWRSKRNMDKAFLATIEAQLRQAMGAPAAPAVATVASNPAVTAAPVVVPIVPPAMPAVPQPSTPPAMPGPSVAAAANTAGETFAEFMARLAPNFAADPLNMTAKMSAALQQHGLSAIGQLSARPDLIPAVSAALAA